MEGGFESRFLVFGIFTSLVFSEFEFMLGNDLLSFWFLTTRFSEFSYSRFFFWIFIYRVLSFRSFFRGGVFLGFRFYRFSRRRFVFS